MMTTQFIQPHKAKQEWYLLDARDRVLGRLASEVAAILRGKHKAYYSPDQDHGDFVVVLNADKVRLTGKKRESKKYYRFSRMPGHKKEVSFEQLEGKKPGEALRLAVRGMLPKTSLGRKILGKLKIYAGEAHPHEAQQPSPLSFDGKGKVVWPKSLPSQMKAKPVKQIEEAKEESAVAEAKTEAAKPTAATKTEASQGSSKEEPGVEKGK